jgi:hypothetical protein
VRQDGVVHVSVPALSLGAREVLVGGHPVADFVGDRLEAARASSDRSKGKAIGTAVGVAAAIPVALLDPGPKVLAVVGTVAFIFALTQTKTYWPMYGLYTFSLILLLASPGQVAFEAEERGFQILVGIGLLVVGLFVIHALGSWLAKHDPQPELAPTA